MSQFLERFANAQIKKIVSDLKRGSDIEGAVLVGGKNVIIARDLPEDKNYEVEIPKILTLLEKWEGLASSKLTNGMFTHCILDYNGCKILAKRLDNKFTLLAMLEKRGYIGLAMLNLENSAREIDRIIGCSTVMS